jgi:hypothetical protein
MEADVGRAARAGAADKAAAVEDAATTSRMSRRRSVIATVVVLAVVAAGVALWRGVVVGSSTMVPLTVFASLPTQQPAITFELEWQDCRGTPTPRTQPVRVDRWRGQGVVLVLQAPASGPSLRRATLEGVEGVKIVRRWLRPAAYELELGLGETVPLHRVATECATG